MRAADDFAYIRKRMGELMPVAHVNRVLVVGHGDRNSINNKMFCALVEHYGHETRVTNCADTILALVAVPAVACEYRPDLIIINVLGDGDARVAKAIKEALPDVTLVAVSTGTDCRGVCDVCLFPPMALRDLAEIVGR